MNGAGLFAQPVAASPLTTEDLDKRIADMRAVEGWLRLNLSMLSSSIQALEVQRATLNTLKSYMGFSSEGASTPSPLDIALGIKPSGQAKIKQAPGAQTSAAQGSEALTDAAQAWWGMLQQQFDALAAATAATLPQAASAPADAGAKPEAAPKASKAPRKRAAAPKPPQA
jgi:hypothetical protein